MDQFQTGYKFMKIKIININKVCFSVLFFLSVFGIQCGSKESEPCDYIYLAELMLDNSSISYAVVTFILAKNGSVIDFLEVRFFNPKSPYKCKIEFFDFKRNGAKEIFIKPDDPNSQHKK